MAQDARGGAGPVHDQYAVGRFELGVFVDRPFLGDVG
jgi:hypothetical protein